MDEVSEDQLQQAEDGPADHHHDGLDPTKEGLRDHLLGMHRVDVPDRLSTGTLQGCTTAPRRDLRR